MLPDAILVTFVAISIFARGHVPTGQVRPYPEPVLYQTSRFDRPPTTFLSLRLLVGQRRVARSPEDVKGVEARMWFESNAGYREIAASVASSTSSRSRKADQDFCPRASYRILGLRVWRG